MILPWKTHDFFTYCMLAGLVFIPIFLFLFLGGGGHLELLFLRYRSISHSFCRRMLLVMNIFRSSFVAKILLWFARPNTYLS